MINEILKQPMAAEANRDAGFYVITFNSVSYAISAEQKLADKAKIKIIPTPREIAATCGMALRLDACNEGDALNLFRQVDDGQSLYALGPKVAGKRSMNLINH